MEGTDEANTNRTRGLGRLFQLFRLALLPALMGVALYVAWSRGYFDLEHRRRMAHLVADFRSTPFAFPAFLVFWAVVVSLALPAAIASTLGGAIFGFGLGSLANLLAALLATVLAHTLARRTLRTPILRLFGEHRLLRALRERADMLMLLRLRLMPVAPFATLDYVAGIARVPLRGLLGATAIGVIPSVVAYAYVGSQIMTTAAAPGGGAIRRALWIAGAVTVGMMLLSILPAVMARKRK
jgi:phospholipase D1/2